MFVLLDKKKGISSFRSIKEFAIENNIYKIGHTGTLDVLATGLLLVATDDDTKLINYIDKGKKTYLTTMRLGFKSDTYDIKGKIIATNIAIPSFENIKKNLKKFIGEQEQIPPIFSAKKINGQKAYKLAREGRLEKLKASTVTIYSIKIISSINNEVTFEVCVSRGTYIRSIIHDFGVKIKCGALMTELRRTTIGNLTTADLGYNVNIENMLTLPTIQLTIEQISKLVKGIKIFNNQNKEGDFIIKVNNIICGVVNLGKVIKSKKLFGNKIDTIIKYESN